jgi:hypothetical protein
MIDDLWLPLLVSSNFRPLRCVFFWDWWSLITTFGIFKLLTLVLSVLLWLAVFDYLFWYLQTFSPCVFCPSVIDGLWLLLLASSNFWPLHCLSFCDWRSLMNPFGFFKPLALVLSVLLWLTVSGYPFWHLQTFDPCIVCPSVIDVSDEPFWFLQTFGSCVVCPSVIDGHWLPHLISSKCWPLCFLSFCNWRSLIIPVCL